MTPADQIAQAIAAAPAPPPAGVRPRIAGLALAGIVLLGLLLRFWGLAWGLPERTNLYPDEHNYVLRHALALSWAHPEPDFLNYPTFMCNSIALLHGAAKIFDPGRPDWKAYVIGRGISAASGVLSILAVFFLARRFGNTTGALLAALWMALLPVNVWDSHVAVTDVLMNFWILMALWMSVLLQEKPRARYAVLAGVCTGLAAGAKYTGGLVCLAPFVALCLAAGLSWKRRIRFLALAGVCALVTAFAVTPFSFIRLGTTLGALAYENVHTHGFHTGFGLPAAGWQYHRFIYQFVAAGPFSLGLPLYLAALAGTAWFLFRPDRRRWTLLVFAAAWGLKMGSLAFTPMRYYHPLFSLGALCAGLWLGAELKHPGSVFRRRAAAAVVLLVLAATLAFTISTTRRYKYDTRITADQWLKTHLRPGQVVHAFGWSPYEAVLDDRSFPEKVHEEGRIGQAVQVGTNDLVEISSLHYLRWKRHGHQGYVDAYDRVRNRPEKFELVAAFDSSYLGREFYGRLDPMFRCYFISPRIEFYRHLQPPPGP